MTCFYVAVTLFTGFVEILVEKRPFQFGWIEFEYMVVFFLMSAVSIVLTGFTGFHYMLLLKNMSTIEHVEKRDPTKKDQVGLDVATQIYGTGLLRALIRGGAGESI